MIASVVAFWPLHAVAATPAPQLSAAWSLYYDGKSVAARRGLEDFLTGPEGQDPDKRRSALSTLLQICVHSLSDDCLVRYAPEYAEVLGKVSAATDVQRLDMARDAGYYLYAAQLARGPPDAVAAILKPGNWTHEHPYDVELYLRRQLLAADIALRLDQPLAASRSIDKVLSLAAAVNTPRDASVTLAWALSDAMETLLVLGDAERAYGLFRATGAAIGQALPPRSVDAALFSLRAGLVLEAVGRDADAQRLLDAAVASLDRIELDADVRRRLLGLALEAKAASCALQLELDCARAALARHPAADLYAEPGRVPASPGEVRYLAIRAMSAAFGQTPDPVAAEALKAPLAFRSEGGERDALQVYRAVGAALALPPGVARQARLQDAGRRIRDLARHLPEAPFGAWYRSSSLDQGLLRLALTQAEALPGQDGADVAFTLLQLASRRGRSFDADALTVLGQAHDALQRRSVHQALRLRVRRDAAERERLRTVAEAMLTGPQTGARPQLDFAVRMQFRAYAQRISAASAGLAKAGISTSGTNSVTLKQLQAVLAPDEAALMVAPGVGGLVYMCVRHDAAFRRVAPVDLGPAFTIDARLVQAALTAGNAPSDTLDAQFPVAAAVRLYDRLIRPFEPCLKPGDQILWLPALADTGLPLAALLERAPPRLGTGYDLSQAAWLARSHAVAYAGSASVIVAARTGPRPPAAAFDFLGVGDPEFSGVTAAGEDRTTILMRGVRGGATLAGLPPLPETQDELERSARGFKSATLLVENAATEGGFRRQLGGYRYLSFATHGLLRDDLQGLAEPALALTPVSGQDPLDDGLLTAPEIADLNLSARFVALSACNTANFDLSQMAQDLPALASAFAVAGVPAALGTLWPVESQTGKQVVAATFEGLRAGLGPAQALAQAQRAFLGAPPSRAYLHPRFWAPFVILGDGGLAPAADPGALNLRSVETLGDGSDEVLRIQRAPGAVLTRSSAARNGKERAPGVTASASTGHGPQWRQVSGTASAEAFLAALGARVIVGGKIAAGPRVVPTLESLDAATGAPVGAWRGDGLAEPVATVAGGAALDDRRAAFAVVTFVSPDQFGKVGQKLYVYEVDAALAPRPVFQVEAPAGTFIDRVAFAPLQGDLLLSYSISGAFPYPQTPPLTDDFDQPVCGQEPLTRVERRDLATGALKARADLRGYQIATALARPGGETVLGGSFAPACGEARAAVLAVDGRLGVRALFQDASPGASDVRTLSALPDGRLFLAASKDNRVVYAPLASGAALPTRADVDRALYGGKLVLLGQDGRASTPLLLDAGTSLLVTAADAGDPGDILLGGGIGDAPAVFHLSARLPQPANPR